MALLTSPLVSLPSRLLSMPPTTRSATGRRPARSTSHLPLHVAAHTDSAQRITLEPYEKPRSLLLPNERLGHQQYALPIRLLPIPLRLLQPSHPSLPHPLPILRGPGDRRGGEILKTIIQTSDYGIASSLRLGRASPLVITLLRTILQPSYYKTIVSLRPG